MRQNQRIIAFDAQSASRSRRQSAGCQPSTSRSIDYFGIIPEHLPKPQATKFVVQRDARPNPRYYKILTAGDVYVCTVAPIFDKVAVNRINALANTLTVTAHNRRKLLVYTSKGIDYFGIIPELVQKPQTTKLVVHRDARPSRRLYGVLTAGDDDVCDICEEIAENAPYTSGEIIGLINPHPNCRCSIVPWRGGYRDAVSWEEQLHPRRGLGFGGGRS